MDTAKFSLYIMALGVIGLIASAIITGSYKPDTEDKAFEAMHNISGKIESGYEYRSSREWSENKPYAIGAGVAGGVLLILGFGVFASSSTKEEKKVYAWEIDRNAK